MEYNIKPRVNFPVQSVPRETHSQMYKVTVYATMKGTGRESE